MYLQHFAEQLMNQGTCDLKSRDLTKFCAKTGYMKKEYSHYFILSQTDNTSFTFQYPLCSADPHTVQQISTKLGLSLSTLSQVVNGFLHCYGSEMKPWSNRAQPVLTGKMVHACLKDN